MSLINNKSKIQSLLDGINALPDASSGVELPELSNPGDAASLLAGKELIDGSGTVVTGTMPNNGAISQTIDGLDTKTATIPAGYTSGGTVSIDNTIDNIADEQADLIGQIEAALANKTAASPTLQEKTISPSTSLQSITPDSGYDGLSKVTVNAMPTATQATPSITVSSAGLITASSTQTAGYVSAGTKSATKQLTTQAAQTITPGTSNKTIASGRYLTGTQTIKGDANLVAANIASGVSIFGVTGTHSGGEDVSAETVTYTGLLDDLESAIDALPNAGSGGGSVATCTFATDGSYLHINRATIYSDGTVQAVDYSGDDALPDTLDNVVCGTIVDVDNGLMSPGAPNFTCTNCEYIYATNGHTFVQINDDVTSASVTYNVTSGSEPA